MWLGQDDAVQGLGCPGGCQGTDGNLYEWVDGVDGLGNPVGFWQRGRPSGSTAAPYVRNTTPFLGQVAGGPDGQLYQWVEGIDGLGNSFGFWKRLRRGLQKLAKRALPLAQRFAPFVPGGAAALTVATPFLRQAGVAGPGGLGALYEAPDGSMYQVQGIDAGDELNGFGAGDELDGFGADDELRGLSDDELRGLAADEELNGYGADDELNGYGAGDELDGYAADDELNGMAAGDDLDGLEADDEIAGLEEDELQGLEDGDMQGVDGYVRQGGMNGLESFVPDSPRETPWFRPPTSSTPMWAPLW